MIVGVDVGITGAISLYDPIGQTIEVFDIPTYDVLTGGTTRKGKPKKRKKVDLMLLKKILINLRSKSAEVAIVEKVASQPRDGSIQAFKFGEVYGIVKASLIMLGFDLVEISPQKWKKHHNLLNTEKEDARKLAIQIFGSEYFECKKHHNRADSALIACYGASKGYDIKS